MSNKSKFLKIPCHISERRDITPAQKIVFGEIYSLCRCKNAGFCFAKDEHLCKRTGVPSRSTMQKHLKKLEKKNLISRDTVHMNDFGKPGTWRKIYVNKNK
ncbi:MAG: helix-turn-helix domain-containing protein [bacterium]